MLILSLLLQAASPQPAGPPPPPAQPPATMAFEPAAMLIATGEWDMKKMANVEDLPPRPFLAVLDRIGLPTRIREGEDDRALDFA